MRAASIDPEKRERLEGAIVRTLQRSNENRLAPLCMDAGDLACAIAGRMDAGIAHERPLLKLWEALDQIVRAYPDVALPAQYGSDGLRELAATLYQTPRVQLRDAPDHRPENDAVAWLGVAVKLLGVSDSTAARVAAELGAERLTDKGITAGAEKITAGALRVGRARVLRKPST